MRDHLRPVRLFGRDYFWHRESGQPLCLLPAVPWPEPPPADEALYEALHDVMTRIYSGPMPWPEEESGA